MSIHRMEWQVARFDASEKKVTTANLPDPSRRGTGFWRAILSYSSITSYLIQSSSISNLVCDVGAVGN